MTMDEQVVIRDKLRVLAAAMKDMNDKESAPTLSHYRKLPETLSQAYELLQQGAALCHGTSTKYSLLGSIDAKEQARMGQDLLRGCELLGTACLLIHDDTTGCARATRHYCKRAARAIVNTVLQLVELWIEQQQGDATEAEKRSATGAQRTGAVWEMCDRVLQRKVPQGNRNSMRRDLFTYLAECNETASEFEELVGLGAAPEKNVEGDQDDFDTFGTGMQQYTSKHLPVVKAGIFLVKCSRGSINVVLQCLEVVSEGLIETESVEAERALGVISRLHDLGCSVGLGMTDFGAVLYPPLDLSEVEEHANEQATRVQSLLDFIDDSNVDMPDGLASLFGKVREALLLRRKQMVEASESARLAN